MEPNRHDLTSANDLTLVKSSRAGDRLAFGVLYLRHHAAAWRVACVASRFSPDAELAVIEGFTRVFSALPPHPEDFAAEGVTFRPYLLACVRQAALERARAAGRTGNSPAPLAGLAPDGELVLSSLEHHVVRGALAALPERSRTALWLSDVEAMTPAEISAISGGRPEDIAALVVATRNELRAAARATLVDHEVRAECRFTAAHLELFQTGTLDPAKGVLVRSHLDLCPTCRMRFAELANGPAALAAAVPAAPLLGGEAQHHFFTSLADIRPAERLLPPGIAAAAPAGLPRQTGRVTATAAAASGASIAARAARLPRKARHAGRRLVPAVPAVALVVAWLAVMLSLPQLVEPDTEPGPADLALPAVQAYVPDYLPGNRTEGRPGESSSAAPAPSGNVAGTAGGVTEVALALTGDPVPDSGNSAAGGPDPAPAPAPLVATGTGSLRSSAGEGGTATVPPPAAVPAVPAVDPVTPLTAAAVSPPAIPAGEHDEASPASNDREPRLERKPRSDARPAMPEFARPDVASLRSKAREDSDGRTARREPRRRHTDHAESA